MRSLGPLLNVNHSSSAFRSLFCFRIQRSKISKTVHGVKFILKTFEIFYFRSTFSDSRNIKPSKPWKFLWKLLLLFLIVRKQISIYLFVCFVVISYLVFRESLVFCFVQSEEGMIWKLECYFWIANSSK